MQPLPHARWPTWAWSWQFHPQSITTSQPQQPLHYPSINHSASTSKSSASSIRNAPIRAQCKFLNEKYSNNHLIFEKFSYSWSRLLRKNHPVTLTHHNFQLKNFPSSPNFCTMIKMPMPKEPNTSTSVPFSQVTNPLKVSFSKSTDDDNLCDTIMPYLTAALSLKQNTNID